MKPRYEVEIPIREARGWVKSNFGPRATIQRWRRVYCNGSGGVWVVNTLPLTAPMKINPAPTDWADELYDKIEKLKVQNKRLRAKNKKLREQLKKVAS